MTSSQSEQVLTADWLNGDGKNADPNYEIRFPYDHGPHLEFDIEWWYLTSNLEDENGNRYGLQWTLFRFRDGSTYSPWIQGQIFMGHASLHSDSKHWFNEKFAGAGLGNAGVDTAPLRYHIDSWQLTALENDKLFPALLNTIIVTPTGNAKITLNLSAEKPFILHGKHGYSIKTANASHASHYYSQPFIDMHGTLVLDGIETNVTGVGWYDHEWSSQLSSTDTLGWDWFSVHLDSGAKLMLFRMRVGEENYITGTYVHPNGESDLLVSDQIELRATQHSSSDGREFPSEWNVKIESLTVDINVSAEKVDAFNPGIFSYYEGPISVTGSHTGIGFLELTGY